MDGGIPFPAVSRGRAVLRYIFSFNGIVDLLSFLPYYLPVFFPAGVVAFRMFRVVRIFRLFRINAYYDALNVIGSVLKSKKDQLLSSIFIILVLMTGSSLCMYSLEHEVQPDVFENAFSGFWWAVSTLLTVGYGDIYPITIPGRIFGIIITFLGVGMVAIPTGILSAGFVEQYTRLKSLSDYSLETDIRFIRLEVQGEDHPWRNQRVMDIQLPPGLILAVIQRDEEVVVPRGDTVLRDGDQLVLGGGGLSGRHRYHPEGTGFAGAAPLGGLSNQGFEHLPPNPHRHGSPGGEGADSQRLPSPAAGRYGAGVHPAQYPGRAGCDGLSLSPGTARPAS